MSFGGNTATANINIKSGQSISELQRLEGGMKKFDTATTTAGRNAQQSANLMTTSIRKIDPALASSTKSNIGFANSFTQVNSAVQKNQQSLSALGNNYKQLDAVQGKMGRNLNLATSNMKTMGTSVDTTGSKMSKMGGYMKNNLTNASLLAGGIAGLDDQFHRLTKSQVGYERAQLMQQKSSQKVVKLEEALNKMREKGLQGTNDYAIKLKDLELAKEQEGLMSERAEIAQTTLNEATEDFYVGILPNLIFVGGSAVSMISDLGIKSDSFKKILPALSKGVGGLAGGFTKFGGAIGGIKWGALLTSLGGIALPILAGVAAVWLLVGAFQGLTNVSEDIIEANNLQIDNLNSLQLAYLSIQNTLANMNLAPALTPREKHNLDEYNKITSGKMEELVQVAKDKKKDMIGSFWGGFTEVPPQVKQALSGFKGMFKDIMSNSGVETIGEDPLGIEEGIVEPAKKVPTAMELVVDSAGDYLRVTEDSDALTQGFFQSMKILGISFKDAKPFVAGYIKNLGEANVDTETIAATQERFNAIYKDGIGVLTKAQKYQSGWDPIYRKNVEGIGEATDAATELATGESELAEKTINATAAIEEQNRANELALQTEQFRMDAAEEAAHRIDAFNTALIEENGNLISEAQSLGASEAELQQYVHQSGEADTVTKKHNDTLREKIIIQKQETAAQLKWDEALKSGNKQRELTADGNLKATQQLQEFTNGLVSGFAQSTKYRSGVEQIVQEMHPFVKTALMSTDALQAMAEEGFQNAGDKAAAAAHKMEEFQDGLRTGILGNVIGSEDKKSFNDAWKELDLGDIPKNLRDDFKDIAKEERKLNEEGIELTTGLSLVGVGMDDLSDKKLDKAMGKLTDEFKDWGKEMGGMEGKLASNNEFMTDMEDHVKEFPNTYAAWTEAMQDHNITIDEYNEIMKQYGIETGNAVEPTSNLNEEQQKIADNNILARTIDQVTTNIESQTTALDTAKIAWDNYNSASGGYQNVKGDSYGDNSFGDGDCIDDYGNKVSCSGSGKNLPHKGNNPKTKKMPKGNEADIANNTPWSAWDVGFTQEDTNNFVTNIQTLQKAIDSLKTYGIKNLSALAKAAKTNFDTVANYAKGATTFLQENQVALGSLSSYGSKNLSSLAKQAKTNFNTVANYASGATDYIQENQTALGSLSKYGAKNMSALAKSAKTNFNTVANYADGATTAVQDLQKAINSLEDKTVNVTVNKQSTGGFGGFDGGGFNFAQGGLVESKAKGDVKTVNRPTLFLYGDNPGNRETLAFIPHNNPTPTLEKIAKQFGSEMSDVVGGGGRGSVVHIHNHYLEREVQQIINVERGRMVSRMG